MTIICELVQNVLKHYDMGLFRSSVSKISEMLKKKNSGDIFQKVVFYLNMQHTFNQEVGVQPDPAPVHCSTPEHPVLAQKQKRPQSKVLCFKWLSSWGGTSKAKVHSLLKWRQMSLMKMNMMMMMKNLSLLSVIYITQLAASPSLS